ncbi:Uncharacterised protein [Budvicia aquatica]|uniref:Invasin domain-containing protein n=1 Tax=Budvicia aquatica TaxID=82979 RepID=A0A484ZZM3_9GAMM|nr:Uncharacterised protein [Budvicia aquatica]
MTQDITGTPRSTLAALVAAALIGGVAPVWAAVLSQPTGTIEGRAPTLTGDHEVVTMEGDTVVDNGTVSKTVTPDMFALTGNLLSQVQHDADGDTGLLSWVDQPSATYVWKHNGTPLAPAQLSTPLYTSFPGSAVTLEVGAEVLTTTQTGSPWMNNSPILTSTYTLNVPAAPIPLPASVKLNVNGYQFAGNSGFPRTGYTNASYQIWMNGTSTANNSAYIFTSDSNWVSVGRTTGIVSMNRNPGAGYTAAIISITAVDGTTEYKHVVHPRLWGRVSAPARSAMYDGNTMCPPPENPSNLNVVMVSGTRGTVAGAGYGMSGARSRGQTDRCAYQTAYLAQAATPTTGTMRFRVIVAV